MAGVVEDHFRRAVWQDWILLGEVDIIPGCLLEPSDLGHEESGQQDVLRAQVVHLHLLRPQEEQPHCHLVEHEQLGVEAK